MIEDNHMTEEQAAELMAGAIVIFEGGDTHRCKIGLLALNGSNELTIAGGELKCGDISQNEQQCQLCIETSNTLKAMADQHIPATLCDKCFDQYEIATFIGEQMRSGPASLHNIMGVEPV